MAFLESKNTKIKTEKPNQKLQYQGEKKKKKKKKKRRNQYPNKLLNHPTLSVVIPTQIMKGSIILEETAHDQQLWVRDQSYLMKLSREHTSRDFISINTQESQCRGVNFL